MSDRRRVAPAACLLLATITASGRAQTAAEWGDSVRVLTAAVRALRDSLVRGDSSAAEVARQGDLAIAASPRLVGAARPALDSFALVRHRWFSDASPGRFGFRITVRHRDPFMLGGGSLVPDVLILAGLPDTGAAARAESDTRSADFESELVERFTEMMYAALPSPLMRWLGSPPPLWSPAAERRQLAMYDFVTTTGAAERGCISGDIRRCLEAFQLPHAIDAPIGPPFDETLRGDLFLTALDVGGPGAWSRLRDAADTDVAGALMAAASMPIDSVVRHWRARLLTLHPNTVVLDTRTILTTLGWLVAAGLAMLGASRWA